MLIAFRLMQGLAGGLLVPAGQTVLGQLVGAARLGRVMATLGIAVSVAPALGPLAGGLILHTLSWPWLFAINLPIGLVGLLLGLRYVPRGRPATPRRIDPGGLALITVGLPLVVFAVTRWGDTGRLDTAVLVTAAPGPAALVWFVQRSRTHPRPLLDLSPYRNRLYRAASLASAFTGALIFGSGLVITLYFELGRHFDVVAAGLSLLGFAGAGTAAPLTGRAVDRFGPAPVSLVGGVLAVLGTVPFVFVPAGVPVAVVQPLLVVYGAAVVLVGMPPGISAYQTVAPDQLSDATAQVNILQRVGGSLGGAVFVVLVAADLPNADAAFKVGFLAVSIGALGAVGAALLIMRATRSVHTSAG